jgi:uncharacterized RDD family membrane protein YckC
MATPRLRRRLACFVYEGVLLFGVVMASGLVYGVATQQRHALVGTPGLQAFLFVVLALYFVYFWSRSGQTLAMQTWRIRVVTQDGQALRPLRALCRYLLAWMWFVPALITLHLTGLKGAAPAFAAILAGVLGYAALVWLHADRQYWHDVVCKCRVVTWHPTPRKLKA